MQLEVHDWKNKKVGTVELPDEVFGAEVKNALLWEEVKAQRASARRGTHKTKKRGEVSGGGIKPFKQKGSGRARQGSIRAPNHVHGGTVFGPQPRDYSYRLPRSARRSALRSVLSLRVKEKNLVVLDQAELKEPKTKTVVELLGKLGTSSALLVDGQNANLFKSVRNLQKSKFVEAKALNVYDVLDHDKLVIAKSALDIVVQKALGQNEGRPPNTKDKE
jgi:large subunit ribosomal protein L4